MKNVKITKTNQWGTEYTLEFSLTTWTKNENKRIYLKEISGKRPVEAGYIDTVAGKLVESKSADVGTRIAADEIFTMYQRNELM